LDEFLLENDYVDDDDDDDQDGEYVTVPLDGLGLVKGIVETHFGDDSSEQDLKCHFFGGIPYAEAPVGNRRWAPPIMIKPWLPTILDATNYGSDCHQVVDPLLNPLAEPSKMSEDCLSLNVFRPARPPEIITEIREAENDNHSTKETTKTLLPVMVWFHGGAFQQGSSRRPEYDARRLVSHDDQPVIVVTVNYRLGALGFMVSRQLGLYGNFGLMDQRAALHFVKQHIRSFGGDPDNITLFGESAGAVMIGLHLQMDNRFVPLPPSEQQLEDDEQDDPQRLQKEANNSRLFHKAILQSNPMGYQFRSVVVADFLGDALRRAVDCYDLDCMRNEPVEDIMRAQSSLMGVPRSVGDFFAWGPTLTTTSTSMGSFGGSSSTLISPRSETYSHVQLDSRSLFTSIAEDDDDDFDNMMRETIDGNLYSHYESASSASLFAVNVTQPLLNLDKVPGDIPIIIGTNAQEGEMFVHGAFPISMSKAVYWMFVGALFKDSAPKVLKHYRPYVHELEDQAKALAERQLREEEARQYVVEHQSELELEYNELLKNSTVAAAATDSILHPGTNDKPEVNDNDWKIRGGAQDDEWHDEYDTEKLNRIQQIHRHAQSITDHLLGWAEETKERLIPTPDPDEIRRRQQAKAELEKQKAKERLLKAAAKVVIDYRPVMSRIISDYLFRCPSWHYAHILSLHRVQKAKRKQFRMKHGLMLNSTSESSGKSPEDFQIQQEKIIEVSNNVFVYRFSHPTHIPGFQECWGRSCHTAELPFIFEAMDIIRSDYSTLSQKAQDQAPTAPEYPYTDLLAAYNRSKFRSNVDDVSEFESTNDDVDDDSTITKSFRRILRHVLGESQMWDTARDDADHEVASEMARRWIAFARTGNPNFDSAADFRRKRTGMSAKEEWVPWRYVPKDDDDSLSLGPGLADRDDNSFEQFLPWDQRQLYQLWHDLVERDSRSSVGKPSGDLSEVERQIELGKAYRRRALEVMEMEVVEDDSLRTEFRRKRNVQSSLSFVESNDGEKVDGGNVPNQQMIRRIQRFAQDMGVLGSGLRGDERWLFQSSGSSDKASGVSGQDGGAQYNTYWDDAFFPQLLEIKWPSEGRLIERDCSCDFWERIRCKSTIKGRCDARESLHFLHNVLISYFSIHDSDRY
jgi:carboxylesterase type B